MAHPLGAFFSAPHGVANGILLGTVMEFNAAASGEKYRDIADAFGVEGAYTMPLDEARAAAVAAVKDLTVRLENPLTISAVGATEADLDELAQAAFDDVCAGGNPRGASVEEIKELYASLV